MKLTFSKFALSVVRESGDPKYYGDVGGKGESLFLYAVKKAMIKLGYDVIKKRMYKDGHLVDDLQQYIRTRDGESAWYNDHWAIRGLNDDFNAGEAILRKA